MGPWARGAVGYLRALPGPAWTMALWIGVIITSRVIRGLVDGAPLSDWVPQTVAESLFLMAILTWPRTPRDWLPKALLGCQLAVIFALMLTDTHPEEQLGDALGIVFAVLYAGIWWRGWLPYGVATAGSLMYLFAAVRLSRGEELDDVWLMLTFTLFGVAVGIHVLGDQIDRRMTRDPLTGVLNRRGLEGYLPADGASGRHATSRTLVVIDLDGFKAINDSRGHVAGDEVLRACVLVWQRHLRAEDLLFRTGGDEFLLVLPSTDPAGAAELIARLRAVSPSPFSMGIAEWPVTVTFDAAFGEADRLMYRDKTSPRRDDA